MGLLQEGHVKGAHYRFENAPEKIKRESQGAGGSVDSLLMT